MLRTALSWLWRKVPSICLSRQTNNFAINRIWAARKLGVLVLMTTSWPRIQVHAQRVVEAVEQMTPGEYREISF
jgi:hypothetical protein